MSNAPARKLYNQLASFIVKKKLPLDVVLEALELTTREFEDRDFDGQDTLSWAPDTPIDAVTYAEKRLCNVE